MRRNEVAVLAESAKPSRFMEDAVIKKSLEGAKGAASRIRSLPRRIHLIYSPFRARGRLPQHRGCTSASVCLRLSVSASAYSRPCPRWSANRSSYFPPCALARSLACTFRSEARTAILSSRRPQSSGSSPRLVSLANASLTPRNTKPPSLCHFFNGSASGNAICPPFCRFVGLSVTEYDGSST
ncbi:hypothetical protein NDU88_003114 [Pleurodeles waltl]|uniref:Uncharacterized protein n=1 Tax=Pleurodeles waltl TaxID=8319 RepID=A0AAV7WS47_PLEWA|nr:hypothetical protein NDU88_003114 [Pleurodeles waltl]